MRKNQSLRNRVALQILITVAISIILVAAAGCYVTVVNYNKSHNQTIAAELKNCSNTMNAWLSEKSSVTEFMAQDIILEDYISDSDKCLEYLVDCILRDEQVFDCYVCLEDKTCLFGGGWEPAPGEYDPTVREWYIDAKNSDGVIITDPYTDAQTGKQVITLAKKIEQDGKVIGVLARDIFIDRIAEIVNELRIDENGYALLMTGGNNVIVHKNASFNPYVDDAGNDAATNMSEVIASYPPEGTGSELVEFKDYDGSDIYYSEITVEATGWKLGYALNNAEYNHTFYAVSKLLAVLVAIFIIVVSAWVLFSLRNAFKPIQKIENTARKVAEGSLNVSFDYAYNDEIGRLCRTIEENNAAVKKYIDDISARLDDFSHGRFTSKSEVEYFGDYASIKLSLDNIGESLHNVFGGIDDASTAVFGGASGVSDGANQLAMSVAKQTELIAEMADEIGKVSEQIGRTATRTDDARNIASSTADMVKNSNEHMTELLKAMDDIAKSSQEIGNIIKTIEDIAFQTNILALNASVEAARAGVAGKGFAVVADEVRNLASKSSLASEKTTALISRSAEAVKGGMKFADATSDSLRIVVEQTDAIDGIIAKINEDSHRQMEYVNNVIAKMGLVSEYVSNADTNAKQSAVSSEQLNNQAAALRDMLREFGV